MRRIVLLTLLLAAGCQSVTGPGTATPAGHVPPAPVVRGRALYLERILPPPDATIDVQLIDDDIADAAGKYADLFWLMTWIGLGCAVLAFIVAPLLKRMMHGVR